MTPEQAQEFERHGITRLPAAVDPDVARSIRDRVWQHAEQKLGVREHEPSTWRRVPPSIMKKLNDSEGLFEPILGVGPTAALNSLLGKGQWGRPLHPGTLLMTPPTTRDWELPHQMWHMDSPAPARGNRMPGAQLFLLLDHLEEREGGTLVVAGSHRLIGALPERENPSYEGHSAQVRQALQRRVPWLCELWKPGRIDERIERFMERVSEHEGIPLRVLQMTGEPGDVFVMHFWMLHAASMNCGRQMRMMLTERLFSPAPAWLAQSSV